MRVYEQNLTGTSVTETGRSQETQRTGGHGRSGAVGTGGSQDRVEFSNTFGTVSRAIASHDVNRGDRVDQLAAQYASGNYVPDPVATGHSLVSEALAYGGR